MNKVVTVNLNGRAYQLEERGFAELKTYLGEAKDRLAADPDRDEIIADLEQAIADKCEAVLTGAKNVVSDKEVARIIADMGPVGPDAEASSAESSAGSTESDRPAKRFHLIKEGQMIGGVCTGIAAYFNVDVTVVRLLAILLGFITSGAAAGAYIVAMMIAPVAKTPEQKAAARGESFNSQELIDQARKKYGDLAKKEHWQTVMRENQPALAQAGNFIRRTLVVLAYVGAVVLTLALIALTVPAVSGAVSLVSTGQVFGLQFQPAVNQWVQLGLIGSAYFMLAVPLLLAATSFYKYARGRRGHNAWGAIAGLAVFTLAFSVFMSLITSSPELRDILRRTTQSAPGTYCIGFCADEPQPTTQPEPSIPAEPASPSESTTAL